MVVQMCDFMNSQETRIAYLKWRSQKGITCTWYMLRYCLLLRHDEKQRVARRSVRCVRKEKKKLSPGDISWDAQKCMERDSQTGIAGERTPE